ncbi:hypothetical protein [Streptomyces sp. SPB074]|uniref:hypothetical protein n=1 Tax=Streptomyces sp. (strain SPB074) TaxID=465543 RepID=UPI0026C0AE8A
MLLALWPVLAADRSRTPVPRGLRPRVCAGASAVMALGAVLLLASLLAGRATGIVERALTFVQAVWPLLVVLSCRRRSPRPR